MEGKEAIIARIIGDAKNKAEVLLRDADTNVAESEREAKEWIADYLKAQRKLLAENVVTRRKTVAELDCRKVALSAKQAVISEVFERALQSAESFPEVKYLEIVEKLCNENAEEGDTLILAASAPLKEADIAKLPVFKEKKLKFGGTSDKFRGGIMLVNDVCDKDLSFKALLDNKKDELEAEIAAALFA